VVDRLVDRPSTLNAYRTVVASRLRSQLMYRASFGLDVLGSATVAVVDFAEVYVIFHNVPLLGGLDAAAAFLLFGLATMGFALANAVCGQLDDMPTHIRTGALEVMLLRPQPLLAQVITNDIVLKRIGGAAVSTVVLGTGLSLVHIHWTPQRLVLLAVTPLAGAAVFSALFLTAGALQFWMIDAAEVTNSFTYGSSYAARFSAAVLPLPVRALFAFVVPAAFTAYLPTLALLGLPGPPGLPAWLGWCGPLVAIVACGLAATLWRLGVRHYTGAGG
jgi:ABC-2 type transport system permease protein